MSGQLGRRAREPGFYSPQRPDRGPNQPPIQWVPGAPSPQVKLTDNTPPSSAEAKNDGHVFMA
jgi:hypothetical protein